jgi:hypothetical protein
MRANALNGELVKTTKYCVAKKAKGSGVRGNGYGVKHTQLFNPAPCRLY